MSYPYPADPTIVAQTLLDIVTAAAGTFDTPVAADALFFGDQDRIAKTPTICVEPGDKQRTLEGVPNMTLNEFTIYILLYHNKVQDNQDTRKEVDHLAYQVEFLLHQNLQLVVLGQPLMIHGYVTNHESGYTSKANTLYRSARLTWYGKNKTSLPVA